MDDKTLFSRIKYLLASRIEIIQQGRSGQIVYREGWRIANACEFYWEFSGGDTLATVWFPAEAEWEAQHPWAKGRRKEVVSRVAEYVRRKKAPSCRVEWAADRFHLVLA